MWLDRVKWLFREEKELECGAKVIRMPVHRPQAQSPILKRLAYQYSIWQWQKSYSPHHIHVHHNSTVLHRLQSSLLDTARNGKEEVRPGHGRSPGHCNRLVIGKGGP